MSQIDEPFGKQDAEDSNYKVPVGKGVIRLKLSDQNARTIMPDPDSFKLEDMFFEVKFTNKDNSTDIVWFPHGTTVTDQATKTLEYDDFNNIPITLTKDITYNIILTAYEDEDRSTPIAGWNNTLVTEYENGVTVGSSTSTVNANLHALIDHDYTGLFDYYITIPDLTTDFPSTFFTVTDAPTDYNVAEFDLIEYTSKASIGSSFGFPVDVSDSGNFYDTDVDIPSGYYIVRITLTADNCQDRIIEEIMHIYPAMKSVYGTSTTPKTVDIPNQNVFTIRLDSSDGSIDDSSFGTSGVLELDSINNGELLGSLSNYDTPNLVNYNFDNWTTTQGGSTVFANTKRIYQDRVLYAKWSAKSSVQFTMSFTLSDKAILTPASTNPPAIAHENFLGAGTGSLTFSINSGFKNIVWKVENKVLSGGSGNSITIDKDTTLDGGPAKFESLLSNGKIRLTVDAVTNDTLEQAYGAYYDITVYNP